ncbi:hypothetical protein FRX31_032193, partial [Thalictrum thalictroides]
MVEPVGQEDITSNSQQQPNISVLPTTIGKRKRTSPVWNDFALKLCFPKSLNYLRGGVYKDEGGLETVDKAIADFEEDEDCGT